MPFGIETENIPAMKGEEDWIEHSSWISVIASGDVDRWVDRQPVTLSRGLPPQA
ncbi:MAG: hypothetical protein JW986_03710 [Methanotrichaceae archaeon]|nr:hypothetical protein [Methanotrichaceae archaeon]